MIFRPRILRTLTTFMLALSLAMPLAHAKREDVGEVGDVGWYEDALKNYHARDYKEAMRSAQVLLTKNPNHLPARVLMGRIHLRLGNAPAAEKEFRIARSAGADPNVVLPALGEAYLLQAKYDELLDEIKPDGLGADARMTILIQHGQIQARRNQRSKARQIFQDLSAEFPNKAEPLIGEARLKLADGDYRAAEELADQALLRDPQSTEAWQFKGEARWVQGDLANALKAFETVLEQDPGHIPALLGRAGVRLDLGENELGMEDAEWVLERVPHDAQATYLKSQFLERLGRKEEADQVLLDASAIISAISNSYVNNDPPSLLLRGLIEANSGNFEAAVTNLSAFTRLRPHHVGGRKLYGWALIETKQYLSASAILEPLRDYAPNDPGVYALLAQLYMAEKRHDQAIQMWQKAVQLAPNRTSLRLRLGMTQLAAGADEKGLNELEAAARAAPESLNTQLMLAHVYLQRRNAKRALEIAGGLMDEHPDDLSVLMLSAMAYFQDKQLDKAEELFIRARDIDPEHHPAILNLAKVQLKKNDMQAARATLLGLLDHSPSNIQAMDEIARIDERTGDVDSAIVWLEKIRNITVTEVMPMLRLARLYSSVGKPEKAVELMNRVQPSNRDRLDVAEAIAKAEEAAGNQKKARAMYRRLSQMAGDQKAHSWLIRAAQGQRRVGDMDAAHWSLSEALKIKPGHFLARYELAGINLRMGKLKEGKEMALAMQKEFTTLPMGDRLVGDVFMLEKKPELALVEYEKAQKKEPSSSNILRIYRSLVDAGKDAQGIKRLEAWLITHPADLRSRRRVIGASLDKGDLPRAGVHLTAYLEERPNDGEALNNLAWVYFRTGDNRALRTAEKAVEMSPDSATALDTLGWILVESGEAGRALPRLREALARNSQNPNVRYHLAVALQRLNRGLEAKDELKRAMKEEGFLYAKEAKALLESLQ